MNYQRIIKIGIAVIGSVIITACGSSQNTELNQREGMPPASEMIAQMDLNSDGKLSISEVKGPLQNDFSNVDSNNDGYITVEELESALKPIGNPGRGNPRQGIR